MSSYVREAGTFVVASAVVAVSVPFFVVGVVWELAARAFGGGRAAVEWLDRWVP